MRLGKTLPSLFLFLCLACSKEMRIEEGNAMEAVPAYAAAKISNSPEYSSSNILLLKLGQAPDTEMLAAFRMKGIVKIERLFSSTPGKEEIERKFNLDKWYKATLEEGAEHTNVAIRVAAVEEVMAVQYNNLLEKASDGIAYPYTPDGLSTRAAETARFNDPARPDQWNYKNYGSFAVSKNAYAGGDINVEDVWAELTAGDNSIIVAVLDEGVKYNHPDLAANMWTDEDGSHGHNFVSDGPITWDRARYENNRNVGDTGHGTHCAGTIAAVNNNKLGVCGIAGGTGNNDGVKIMSCQIFDSGRSGGLAATAAAIKYAADNGASIISCSFGYPGGTFRGDKPYIDYARAEYDALCYFESTKNNPVLDGSIAIFASGNDGDPYATYPGALSNVISVSAFGPDFLPAYYTNYGPGCNIVAPGGENGHLNGAGELTDKCMILSTLPKELYGADYGYMQGTSMACPHVSGIAALALSYAKKLGKTYTTQEFKDMIVTSANDFDSRINGQKIRGNSTMDLTKYRKQMGTGSIDAWKLMMKIEGVPSKLVACGQEQWVDLSDQFGTSSPNLTYLKVEVLGNGKESLGLAKDPDIRYGRLFIHPTKIGAAKIKITAVGGGAAVGTDKKTGGMQVSQVISVISRNFKSDNGGWL
ncbi:MAG: S8 family serine peptidase [Bacteroidales bacterium]|jgi:serine protease|nr:S8 family serine peptidase [Bacteroidota bacterium]NLN99217.1 S8 family serine peptidase [Bacteroidales bacterium]